MQNDSANVIELWHVQTPSGVRTLTLDELDSAFQSGAIDERTMVLKGGALRWTTLADAAGLEPSMTPPPVSVTPSSIAPFAVDVAPAPPHRQPAPSFDLRPGADELAAFAPRRRSAAPLAMVMAFVVMAGGVFALKSNESLVREKVAALVKGTSPSSARAVAVAPPAESPLPPPPSFQAPPMANAPSVAPAAPVVVARPAAQPVKKKAKGIKARAGGTTAEAPVDATTKGSDHPLDPLNGNL